MLVIPRKSLRNAAQPWKLEVNGFIISKVMAKILKITSFWLFKATFQCKMPFCCYRRLKLGRHILKAVLV